MDHLCFGTSTFVAGTLRPDKNSVPGMAALHAAVEAGVRLIHSNPNLRTQWAVRRVLDQVRPAPPVRHLIKAEAPLDAEAPVIGTKISRAIAASRTSLAINRVHALVLEIDIKRTQRLELLDDEDSARLFYRCGARAALALGYVDHVYAYCHRPANVTGALACADIAGIAAQYHRSAPWAANYLADITATNRVFVGMSPLNRGRLVDHRASTSNAKLAALRWALDDSRVSAVAITMSSVAHLAEVIQTAGFAESHRSDNKLDYRLIKRVP